MSRGTEREEYWHWFHGLTGITYKEKEALLALCPDVKAWYEAAEQKRAEELFEVSGLKEAKVYQNKIVEQLQSETQREDLRKSYDQLKKMELR